MCAFLAFNWSTSQLHHIMRPFKNSASGLQDQMTKLAPSSTVYIYVRGLKIIHRTGDGQEEMDDTYCHHLESRSPPP